MREKMKRKRFVRILSMVLIVVLMVGVSGCGTKGGKEFQAGFGKTDITPGEGVELGSYGDSESRKTIGTLSSLYALTVALTDAEDNTLILIVTDLSWGSMVRTNQIRTEINNKYEIPKENIMLAGTHNHSAPDDESEHVKNVEYMEQWKEAVMESVDQALEDRKPATMEIGRTETERLNFSRRYVRSDGNYVGGGPSEYNVPSDAPIVGHESEADEEIQMVRFVREGEKDILITNWQSHACNIDADRSKDFHYMASGEWPGIMRECVEEELGVHCIFFQGAAANLGCTSRIEGEFALEDSKDFEAIGEALAGYVVDACEKEDVFQKVNTGLIQTNQYKMTALRRDGSSIKQEDKKPELNTISIGDLSIVTLPIEMFDSSGMWLKERTPYEMTLLMGHCCGNSGYQAPDWAYEHGAYEVLNGAYQQGTAEDIMNHYLETLEELHKTK